jgi:hypothetical protein
VMPTQKARPFGRILAESGLGRLAGSDLPCCRAVRRYSAFDSGDMSNRESAVRAQDLWDWYNDSRTYRNDEPQQRWNRGANHPNLGIAAESWMVELPKNSGSLATSNTELLHIPTYTKYWAKTVPITQSSNRRSRTRFRVMLRFWGMGDSMIRAVILMAFALN